MTAYQRTVRLSKVARESNTALDTIVDILDQKGYKIEKKPYAKLNLHMYDLIEAEFSDSLDGECTTKGRNPVTKKLEGKYQ